MQTEPATILIIDDQPSTLHALAQTLKQDWAILVATNGKDALDIAHRRRPDLILLDVVMPDMSGLEVCTILKADPDLKDIPVIFVTAKDEAEDEAAGLAIGAIDYISKPFNPPIVRARVRNHLELKRQGDLLRRIAMIDGLTGAANRRAFDQALAQEWRRAQRTGGPVSLILVDVDHFKAFNDTYGHQDGDDCLRAIATSLGQAMQRPADMVARYGGEEFVCLLPETDLIGALALAEHLRTGIESLAIAHRGSTTGPQVTISLGVSCCLPSQPQITAEAALRQADAFLYQAKRQGRNQVVGVHVDANGLPSTVPPDSDTPITTENCHGA